MKKQKIPKKQDAFSNRYMPIIRAYSSPLTNAKNDISNRSDMTSPPTSSDPEEAAEAAVRDARYVEGIERMR